MIQRQTETGKEIEAYILRQRKNDAHKGKGYNRERTGQGKDRWKRKEAQTYRVRQRKTDAHKNKDYKRERTGQALETEVAIQRQRNGERDRHTEREREKKKTMDIRTKLCPKNTTKKGLVKR